MNGKIQRSHLERRAYVYVRQSTAKQVFENTESTTRQYALAERARALGWSQGGIEIIDEDLGRSGAVPQSRVGFSELTQAVAQGEAGAIFALEVSRLARTSQDWQRLLALCAVAEVVVADEQAIYDPRNGDDKLLLDVKGTMSEAELHWLSLRLRGALNNLAKRGELRFKPPTGFVWGGHGFEKDPDLAVQSAIGMIFERFDIEPSVGRVVRWARQSGFRIPTRRAYADGTNELTWTELYRTRVKEMLKNPLYAGAYAYGRRRETKVIVDGEIHTARRCQDPDEWTALIQDAHEGYISWEAYLRNQARLRENATGHPSKGAPREGRALLSGVLVCGRCGRSMIVRYQSGGSDRWSYVCAGENTRGAKVCWMVSGAAVDAAVEALLLRMIIPSELDLTLALEREVEFQSASLNRQWKLRLEKAGYEARRAERRYKAVDPDNRVVARTLEGEWEACLEELETLRQRYETARRQRRVALTGEDRERVRALARDLPSVWHAPTTSPADRKAMLRIAIEAITIRPVEVPKRSTQIQVQWASGAVDELCILRIRTHRASDEAIERIGELAARGMEDEHVAETLNEEQFTTGLGRRWSACAVKRIRLEHTAIRRPPNAGDRQPLPDRHPDGRYSVRGAMKRFGVNDDKVRNWIKRGLVEGVREAFDWCNGAWWLSIDEATAKRLEEDATKRRRTTKQHNAGVPGRR
jgi:DNA invertase Pin-like site-specific DNA recombinase